MTCPDCLLTGPQLAALAAAASLSKAAGIPALVELAYAEARRRSPETQPTQEKE